MSQSASTSKLFVFALSEWLLALPAAVLLSAAALRLLQPRQYEPGRTSWAIFDWATTHVSQVGAGLLFIGLPATALIAGCTALPRIWRGNETLRQDLTAAISSLRRHLAIAILGTGTPLAGMILAGVVVHMVTD